VEPARAVCPPGRRHRSSGLDGDRLQAIRTLTERGLIYFGTSADGVVLRDVGQVTFEPGQDFETVASMHGIHDFYADPSLIDRLLCDTLT
jgi:hypothetical protein